MPMARLDELEQLLSALQRTITYELFGGFNSLIVFSVKQDLQHHRYHMCAASTCSTMMPQYQSKEYMHKHSRQLLVCLCKSKVAFLESCMMMWARVLMLKHINVLNRSD